MNIAQALSRLQQPLQLPEQPISTQSVHPWLAGVSSMPPGQQVAQMQDRAMKQQQYQEEALKKSMGSIGSNAVDLDLYKYNQGPTSDLLQRSGAQNPYGVYGLGGKDIVNTFGMNNKSSNEYNPAIIAHEFRHRALTPYGLDEGGNRAIDMYMAREIGQDNPLFGAIAELEAYLTENPLSEMSGIGGQDPLAAGMRMNFRDVLEPEASTRGEEFKGLLRNISLLAKDYGFNTSTYDNQTPADEFTFKNYERNAFE